MKRVDMVIKLESDGTSLTHITAVVFDLLSGEIKDKFEEKCDFEKKHFSQNHVSDLPKKSEEYELGRKLVDWMNKFDNIRVWFSYEQSADFMKNRFKKIGLSIPLFYQNEMNIGTVLDLASFYSEFSKSEIKRVTARDLCATFFENPKEKIDPYSRIGYVISQAYLVSFCLKMINDVNKKPLNL